MDIKYHTPYLSRLANEGMRSTNTYYQYLLCDLSSEPPEILQGKSYANLIKDNHPISSKTFAYTIANEGKGASIKSRSWRRHTKWGDDIKVGNEALYSHLNDPEELKNLVNEPDKNI